MLRDMSEKVSYLQGLTEGMNITESSPQGKIISGMLNVMNEMADELNLMQQDFAGIKEYIESIDDDLFELEETVLDEEEFTQIKCRGCGEKLLIEKDILDDEDHIEVICPSCNEVVYINDGSFDFSNDDADD
ncbi:MAG TPA: AraC family transcriptional regulator, partial [Syntrophomonas sp.]|nr:AraC family transcriptional regulator [Syntrophomonas sp.]